MPATYGFLSTYPPTQCGLATFNAALAAHLNAGAGGNGVVRLLAGDDQGGLTIDRAAPAGGAHLADRQRRAAGGPRPTR